MNLTRSTAVIILAAIAVACSAPAEPVTTTLVVEGMHCQSCSDAIVGALNGLEGVGEATADFETGVTTARHVPDAVSDEVLKTTVEDLGYTVVTISRD